MLKRFVLIIAVALYFSAPAYALTLDSPSIPSGGTFSAAQTYHGFGCVGSNISPALRWRDVPQGTRSFALTLYDPDAPTGSGWWHWVVVNLPASTRSIPAGAGTPGAVKLPKGALQIRNDFGTEAYGGPCPPKGSKPHHYTFTIYALKTAHLQLPSGASAAMAGYLIHANAIASARLIVRYGR